MKIPSTKYQILNTKSDAGFTLIELIISISIMAILAGFLLAILNPFDQYKKASDGRRKSDLAQIQRALEQYYQDHGRYPAHSTTSPTYRIVDGSTINWGDSWQPYINVLPKDPTSTKRYVYYVPPTGQTYYLYASLDRGSKDTQVCKSDGSACDSLSTNGINSNSCGKTCNYGVTTPNVNP